MGEIRQVDCFSSIKNKLISTSNAATFGKGGSYRGPALYTVECIGSYTMKCIGEAEEGCQTIPGIFRLSGPWAIHTVSGYLSVLFTYFFAPVFFSPSCPGLDFLLCISFNVSVKSIHFGSSSPTDPLLGAVICSILWR